MGDYGPLVLAPVESLVGPLGHLPSWGHLLWTMLLIFLHNAQNAMIYKKCNNKNLKLRAIILKHCWCHHRSSGLVRVAMDRKLWAGQHFIYGPDHMVNPNGSNDFLKVLGTPKPIVWWFLEKVSLEKCYSLWI